MSPRAHDTLLFYVSQCLNRDLGGVAGSLAPEIVHARFQSLFPCVEMHAGEFPEGRLGHKHVELHGLINVGSPIGRHVDQGFHAHFVGRFVEPFEFVRNVERLDTAFVDDQLLFHFRCPESHLDEIVHEVLVDHSKGSSQRRAGIQVAGDWLKALGITQQLSR